MSSLRKRFGELVAVHRRRRGMTQEALAEAAELSTDMIAKIETGVTGVRFPAIERLSSALAVDPAELFSPHVMGGSLQHEPYRSLTQRLATLPAMDLLWVAGIVHAVLDRPDSAPIPQAPPSPKGSGKIVIRKQRPTA